MKRTLLASIAAAAAFCLAPAAHAQSWDFASPYLKLQGGYSFEGEADLEGSALPVPGEGAGIAALGQGIDLDDGWQASAAIGFDEVPLPNWRLELEGLYSDNDIQGTDATDVKVWGGLANLIYDFNLGEGNRFKPFLGAGVGYGQTEVEVLDDSADEGGLIWQAVAGVAYDVSPATTFEIGYRYLNVPEVNFRGTASNDDDFTDDDELIVNGDFDAEIHAITVGMRWKLGAVPY
jgi:OmpA-OmpF porin, OOP family